MTDNQSEESKFLWRRFLLSWPAFGKKTAEKLRQKRKDNDRRSQTPEESASKLISKKFLHSFWESVFSVFAMRKKFYFSGIAAVGTAVRQWIFGKSKAGADDGGGFGLASEPEEQEETGGSRIALLILLASLTALALWAYDGYDGCYVGRDENCTEYRTLCLPAITDESSPFWRPYDLELVSRSTSMYSTCDTANPGELGYTECDTYEGTCQYEFRQIKHSPSSNYSNIIEFTSAVTETKNVTTGYAWGDCCPHPW